MIYIIFFRDEKTDAYLQAREELEHKNSQYEKLRRDVIISLQIQTKGTQIDNNPLSIQ